MQGMWVENRNQIRLADKTLPTEGFVKVKTVISFSLSGTIQTLMWQFKYFGLNQL